MRRLTLVMTAMSLAACSASGLSPEEQVSRCEEFADLVAKAQLTGTPTEQVARDVASSLDSKLSRLGSPTVHDPAVKLHQQLHAIELAQKKGDTSRGDQAAGRAREQIDALAKACNLPSSRFLGST